MPKKKLTIRVSENRERERESFLLELPLVSSIIHFPLVLISW